jgi:RNA polymerase sigma-70 factor (ECF subfamily)
MKQKEKQFRELLEENESRLRGICRYYAVNSDDFKDLYQEVLTNLWKSLNYFRGDARLSTWVYRVAVNTAMGFAGKELKHRKIYLNGDLAKYHSLLLEETGEENQAEDLREILEISVNQLSVIDKTMIALVMEGVSMKEIAAIIGITEANVRVKVHRLKTYLKESLKNIQH